MGSGIAQKMATEGFAVTLVDLDDDKVARGLSIIKKTLEDGVARGIFAAADVSAILGRVSGTSRFDDLAGVDLVVEAVFENLEIKKDVFRRLDEVCRPDTILATNTSSYAVTDLAAATKYPERVIGLHYFYHPAKNRLVEVVAGRATDAAAVRRAWRAAGSPGQDAHRLERLVRVHRQPVLPAMADRGDPDARRGHGDADHDRRGRKEGIRHRHGTVRAHERHRRPHRLSCRDNARARVRAALRIPGASPQPD